MSRRKRMAQRREVAKMVPSPTYTVEDALEQARQARNGEDEHDHAIRVCRLCQACGAGPWDGPLLTAEELERLASMADDHIGGREVRGDMAEERALVAKLWRMAERVRALALKEVADE